MAVLNRWRGSTVRPTPYQIPTAPPVPGQGGALALSPPTLTSPQTIVVTQAMVDAGEISLFGAGVDWIIRLPDDVVLTKAVLLHGRDQARHIRLIGGSIQVPMQYNPATMVRFDTGDYAVYVSRGFTGATGGTFRIRIALSASSAYTDPIAYDADAATIQAALDLALGVPNSCFVSGTGTGGPWKLIPRNVLLGRAVLDTAGLTGTIAQTSQTNVFNGGEIAFRLKQWKGTAHVEGLHLGGPGCAEGVNIQNPWDDAVAQFANCHIEPEFYRFHSDHQHPDAIQAYLGPTELRLERCDLICHGSQALMAQPREAPSPRQLDGLRDWWLKDVLLQVKANQNRVPYDGYLGNPFYMEDDWPSNASNQAGWMVRASNVYNSRIGIDGLEQTAAAELQYFNHFPHTVAQSAVGGTGITIKQQPSSLFCDPASGQCGLHYSTPGYTGETVASGTKRLQGETKLT